VNEAEAPSAAASGTGLHGAFKALIENPVMMLV